MVFMHIDILVVIFKVDKTLACLCAEGNDPAEVGKLIMEERTHNFEKVSAWLLL